MFYCCSFIVSILRSNRITFRNFNNNILESYVLNNKHRYSTKMCGAPNHINIATLCIYVLNIIVSNEKLSRSEKSALYDTDLIERAIIKNYWMRLSRISELFRPRSALSASADRGLNNSDILRKPNSIILLLFTL